jgi:hypothetical protein
LGDHGQALQDGHRIVELSADAGGRGQQAGALVVADVGRGDPRALRDLGDGEPIVHEETQSILSECERSA